MTDLYSLCAVALDAVRKRPALLLELLILLELDASLCDYGDGEGIHGPRVAVVQNLHALADDLLGLLAGQLGGGLLIGGVLAHDGLGEHGAEARGQRRGGEGCSKQVGGGEKRLVVLVKPGDEEVVPEGIHLCAAVVEQLGEVLVQVASVEGVLVGLARVGLVDGELRQMPVEVLHVGDVAAKANDGGVGKGADALDVGEAGEGAV